MDPAAVEVPSKRTARSESFRNPDGSYTEALYAEAKYFNDGESFKPIDSSLEPLPGKPGYFGSKANEWSVVFGPLGEPDGGVEIRTAKGSFVMTPDLAVSSRVVPTLDEKSPNVIRFEGVWPDVDLVYTVGSESVKEEIVINSKKAARSSFAMLFDGVELAATSKGRAKDVLDAYSPVGPLEDWVVIPPVVLDKSGRPVNSSAKPRAAVGEALPGQLKRGSGSRYRVDVDEAWLAGLRDEDFPIVVDPTLNTGVNINENFFYDWSSGQYGSDFGAIRVGNQLGFGTRNYRAFVHYPYEHLLRDDPFYRPVVVQADVLAWNSPPEIQNPQYVSASWANTWGYAGYPGYGVTNNYALTAPGVLNPMGCCGQFPADHPFNDWFQSSIAAGSNGAIVFAGAENGSAGYKELLSTIQVSYDYRPAAAINNPSPSNNAILAAGGSFPQLAVDQVTTPDGDDVEYRFVVASTSAITDQTPLMADSGWFNPTNGARVSWNAPQNLNSGGTATLYWRVETRDVSAHLRVLPSPFALHMVASKRGFSQFGGTFNDVNTLMGNYIEARTDLALAAVAPGLNATLTLNSLNKEGLLFGAAFQLTVPAALRMYNPGGITSNYVVDFPDGRQEFFQYLGNDAWLSPPGSNSEITRNGATTTLTTGDGIRYDKDNSDAYGRIAGITDPFGHHTSITHLYFPERWIVHDDASGREVRYFLDSFGYAYRIETNNPSTGGTVGYTLNYDANHNLSTMCDPSPNTSICRTFQWEESPPSSFQYRIKRIYDRNGHLDFELGYNQTGRVTTLTDGLGRTTLYDYFQNPSTLEFTTTITDARGYVWVHKYTPQGNFKEKQAPGLPATVYGYDPVSGMRTTTTDPNGNVATLVYDSDYRVVAEVNGAGNKTFYVHDDAGNRVKECDGRTPDADANNIPDVDTYCTISTYFPPSDNTLAQRKKRLIYSKQAPGLAAETWTYTTGTESATGGGTMPAGLPRTHNDPLAVVTTYDYFASGDVAKKSDTAGNDVRFTYDGWGRKLTETVHSDTYPAGVATIFTYDLVGNLLTETGPVTTNAITGTQHQLRTTYTYDNNRNKTHITQADLIGGGPTKTTILAYDELDREFRTTDPEAGVTERRFDQAGNVTLVKDALGRWLRTTYDSRNRATQLEALGVVANPESAPADTILSQTEYDNAGRTTKVTDALGRQVQTTYDGADREKKVVHLQYKDDSVSTPRNVVVSLKTYDNAGHVTKVEEGETDGVGWTPSRTTTSGYDNAGRLSSSVLSGLPGSNTRTTTLTLNNGDLVTKKVVAQTGVETAGPSAKGVATYEERYEYDAARRMKCKTVENGPGATDDLITRQIYDTRGALISVTPPRGNTSCSSANGAYTTAIVNDQLGRAVQTTSPTVAVETSGGTPTNTNPVTKLGYNAFGEVVRDQDPNGNITIAAYDRLSRKTSVTAPSYTPPGGTAMTPSESFSYDAVGNLASTTSRRGFTTTYEYDIFNRVTAQHDPGSGGGGGPTTLVSDTFAGTNGDAWDTDNWTTEVNWDGIVDIQSNKGRQWVESGDNSAAHALGKPVTDHTDAEVTTSVSFTSLGDANAFVWLRGDDEWGTVYQGYLYNGYYIRLNLQANKFELRKYIDDADPDWCGPSVDCTLDETSYTFAAATTYNLRFKIVGTDLYAKIWTGSEPGGWTLTASDDTFESGRAALSFDVWDSGNRTATWDDYTLTNPNGGGTPGGTTTSEYDLVGNQTAVVDQTGARTEYTYDDRNRPRSHKQIVRNVTVTPAAGAPGPSTPQTITGGTYTTKYDYNDLSQQTKVTSPLGVYTQNNYNVANELMSTLDNDNKGITYTRDALGHEIRLTDPVGRQTRYEYDVAGRTTAISAFANNSATTAEWRAETSYDADGNVTGTKSPQGVVNNYSTTYSYDALQRLSSQTEPVASGQTMTTSYGYDPVGNATRFTDGRSNKFVTTYTSWNQPQDLIEPSTTAHPNAADRTFSTVYDAGGLPVEDRQAGGVTITNSFDQLARLTQQSSGGGSRVFGYDLASRQTNVNHPAGTQTFVYDDRTLALGAVGPAGNTIATYDADGRSLTRNDPAGNHSFTWTTQNELQTAADPLTGRVFSYTYNDARQTTHVNYGSGAAGTYAFRDYTYNNSGWLATDIVKVNTTTKYSSTHTYDKNGNITKEEINTLQGTTTPIKLEQQFDRSDRITQFKRTTVSTVNETTNITWDASGNRLTAGTNTWTYDTRNRILTGPEGTYTWEARGTLDKITASGGAITEHSYDNLGRLTGHTAAGTTTNYSHDGLDRVATRDTTSFSYTGGSLDPAAIGTGSTAQLYSRSPSGRLLGLKAGAATAVIAGLNQHGDLRWTFNAAGGSVGNTVAKRLMNPFGQTFDVNGTTANLGFQGDYTDPTTNDVWMGARWYNPSSAAFRIRDTYPGELKTPITLNRYTYASGNPLKYFDADGRCTECIHMGALFACNYDYACTNERLGQIDDIAQEGSRIVQAAAADRAAAVAAAERDIGYLNAPASLEQDVAKREADLAQTVALLNDNKATLDAITMECGYSDEPIAKCLPRIGAMYLGTIRWFASNNTSISKRCANSPTRDFCSEEELERVQQQYLDVRRMVGLSSKNHNVFADAWGDLTDTEAINAFMICAGQGGYAAGGFVPPSSTTTCGDGGFYTEIAVGLAAGMLLGDLVALRNIAKGANGANAEAAALKQARAARPLPTETAESWAARRAAELQSQLPAGSQGRVTMSAGVVRDSTGNEIRVVATSEPRGYIRPGVKINNGEVVIRGTGHAETDIVKWAAENGYEVMTIGAGRPICSSCAGSIAGSGGSAATPLKAGR